MNAPARVLDFRQCTNPIARRDLGEAMAVTLDAEGMHYFEHLCDRRHRGGVPAGADAVRVGPNLSQHTRTGPIESITVRASILCPDCDLHGWVTNGEWRPCR